MKLWYKNPAKLWTEALPLGNGNIGAMVFGDPDNECICMNNDTLWSGYPHDTGAADPKPVLDRVRQLITNGNFAEADRLMENGLLGAYSQSYLPLCDILIKNRGNNKEPAADYIRELSLDDAVMDIDYCRSDISFHRELFVSKPDSMMAMRISSMKKNGEKAAAISFDIGMESKLHYSCLAYPDTGSMHRAFIVLHGIAPSEDLPDYLGKKNSVIYEHDNEKKGMRFIAFIEVREIGGDIGVCEESNDHEGNGMSAVGRQIVKVRNSDSCEIRFFTATSFNGAAGQPFTDGRNEVLMIRNMQKLAEKRSFDDIKAAHISDYSKLYSSVKVSFGASDADQDEEKIPTDERLIRFSQTGNDPYLYALIYQYGRYLTIASSRPGSQPMNLQGIWNDKLCPPFSCNYTTNINLEMNYWGTEKENLAELGEPLFTFMETLTESGKKTAKKYYGAEGAVVHHNTDIWGMTTPVGRGLPGMSTCAFWNMAYGWLTRHLFEHYEYSLDVEFLRDKCMPALREAARFYISILTLSSDGMLVMPPSSSPENTFIYNGKKAHNTRYTTMSVAIVKEVFMNFIKSFEILNTDNKAVGKEDKELYRMVKESLEKLPPYRIGSRGQLLEWDGEYEEIEPHHRHISHLYPLFPGNELHIDGELHAGDEQLVNACRRSLIERTDIGTGWSLGWKINAWARLQDGNHALKLLKRQLQPTTEQRTLALFSEGQGSGTYPNLFDAHPPFQIDGNFAAASGISEMMLQSYDSTVLILPALPDELPEGTVTGFRSKNALEIDISFAEGRLVKAIVHSLSDKSRLITFVYREKSCRIAFGRNEAGADSRQRVVLTCKNFK